MTTEFDLYRYYHTWNQSLTLLCRCHGCASASHWFSFDRDRGPVLVEKPNRIYDWKQKNKTIKSKNMHVFILDRVSFLSLRTVFLSLVSSNFEHGIESRWLSPSSCLTVSIFVAFRLLFLCCFVFRFWFEIQEISMHVISEIRFELIAMTVMGHCDILPFVEMCCCCCGCCEAITFVCFCVRTFRRHSFTRTELSQQFDQPRQKTHSSSDIVSTKRSHLMTLTIIKNRQNGMSGTQRGREEEATNDTERRKR